LHECRSNNTDATQVAKLFSFLRSFTSNGQRRGEAMNAAAEARFRGSFDARIGPHGDHEPMRWFMESGKARDRRPG
jgi:hypothetical protein